jgi:hypothetical protein
MLVGVTQRLEFSMIITGSEPWLRTCCCQQLPLSWLLPPQIRSGLVQALNNLDVISIGQHWTECTKPESAQFEPHMAPAQR